MLWYEKQWWGQPKYITYLARTINSALKTHPHTHTWEGQQRVHLKVFLWLDHIYFQMYCCKSCDAIFKYFKNEWAALHTWVVSQMDTRHFIFFPVFWMCRELQIWTLSIRHFYCGWGSKQKIIKRDKFSCFGYCYLVGKVNIHGFSVPLGCRDVLWASVSVPGAVGVSGQAAFSTGLAIQLTSAEWNLG